MTHYLNRGPFLMIPDPLRPGQYMKIRNPDWDGELPEIISFTEFLKWNYTVDYGRYIRELHKCGQLPLLWEIPQKAEIKTVVITYGKYDRIDHDSFFMYVVCDIVFIMNGCRYCQKFHALFRCPRIRQQM